MKAPHIVGPGGWKAPHHHPHPKPKPKPPHHKKPPKPKKAPKPKPAPPHRKPRKLSPGSDVACCSAEALGLLLGWDWDQVLALYWRTAADPESGVSIEDTLQAALTGPCHEVGDGNKGRRHGAYQAEEHAELHNRRPGFAHLAVANPVDPPLHGSSLILGVSLPEPHAIAVTPDGTWWSWGQPFNPAEWPDLVIEEAWCLR